MLRLFALLAIGLVLELAHAADDAPQLDSKPVTCGPYLTSSAFEFHCKYECSSVNTSQNFEITWTFNSVADPAIPKQILTGNQRVAILKGELIRSHVDKNVQCTVRTYYTATPRVKFVYYGTINFFGVQDVSLPSVFLHSSSSFSFTSEIVAGTSDANVEIELMWTFDGVQDTNSKTTIITGTRRTSTLPGASLIGHFNSQVACWARLIFTNINITTSYVKSSAFFAGIQTSTKVIQIKGSDTEKTITVGSSVPVVCDNDDNCCVLFELSLDKNSAVSLKDSCSPRICLSDWNFDTNEANIPITLIPNKNVVVSSSTKVNITFTNVEVTGSGIYRDAHKGYKPDGIEIEPVPEPSEYCESTGDPHFKLCTNKAKVYDLYQAGDYTIYYVQERNFIAQIRTWKCGGNVACICGFAVKENNNIIKVHGCDKPRNVAAATLEVAYPLTPGTILQRSSDGKKIGIQFTSGTSIKIELGTTMTNVFINGPASDKLIRRGVCGTNIKGKEFTHFDGSTTQVCSGTGRCIPVKFTESWRVSGNLSLFEYAPELIAEEIPQLYCKCYVDANGKTVSKCSTREHIQDTKIIVCPKCQIVNPNPKPWGHPGNEVKPWEHIPIPPVDPDQTWPNAEGTTEEQGRTLCLEAIKKSALYSKCQSMQSLIDATLDQCLGDILNGGTTEFVSDTTEIFTSACLNELAQNETNYEPCPDDDGSMCLIPDVVENCAADCEVHGWCDSGICVCQSGWAGENCQIDTGSGPQINRTEGLVCHGDQKACESVDVETKNIEIFDKLICHVQNVDDKGNKIGDPLIVNATQTCSCGEVICPLPPTDNAVQKFNVSVCTQNGKCGNELTITTYNPACISCDDTGCRVKPGTCSIGNKCYKDLEKNPQNDKQVCDSKTNQNTWTGGCAEFPSLEEVKNLAKQLCDLLEV